MAESLKQRDVSKSTFTKSMLMTQVDSRKRTADVTKFGTTERTLPGFSNQVPGKELYFTKHHASINQCKASPGPKYGSVSCLGKQTQSKKQSFPSYGFGKSQRFAKSQPDVTEPDMCSPGPGNYNY
eukprot:CAMPEP_0114241770 /NCGR_PEP_ID=MMETSP0058-20121206/9808_1 /TAXON_ID=36894 /ORGANISM="Pyramimonas parkeae, CCMP726" /LENGTH=125 /DNA_ID=CAMNT_0001354315 /DNA_START=29 /DNA_END=406 /DNA_ORIENTATION=-